MSQLYLRKCPFCNGKVEEIQEDGELRGNVLYHVIRCKYCGARSGQFIKPENAVSWWNFRMNVEIK